MGYKELLQFPRILFLGPAMSLAMCLDIDGFGSRWKIHFLEVSSKRLILMWVPELAYAQGFPDILRMRHWSA
jgi:hypothetical protein